MTIYGECELQGQRLAVTISDLGRSGCVLDAGGAGQLHDGEMALWIGAIGPLAAIACEREAGGMGAAFKEPLDPRILDHFTNN